MPVCAGKPFGVGPREDADQFLAVAVASHHIDREAACLSEQVAPVMTKVE